MVIFLFLLLFVVGVGALFFFWNRFHRFHFIQEIAKEHKKLSWLVAFLPVSLLILLFFVKTVIATIISLHLLAFWLLCDFGAWLIKKIRGRRFTEPEENGQTAVLTEKKKESLIWNVYSGDFGDSHNDGVFVHRVVLRSSCV